MGSKDYFDIINQFKEEILEEHKKIKVHGEDMLSENPRPETVSHDFHLENITKQIDSSVQNYYLANLNILNERITENQSSIFGRVENAAITKDSEVYKLFQSLQEMISRPSKFSNSEKIQLLRTIFVYTLYNKPLTNRDVQSIFHNLSTISELKRNQILTSTTLDHILLEAAHNRL